MNRREILCYTGKIVWRKDAIIICLFWSMVFFCLNALVVCGKNMNEQKKTAVDILCEISQEYQEQMGTLRNMGGGTGGNVCGKRVHSCLSGMDMKRKSR